MPSAPSEERSLLAARIVELAAKVQGWQEQDSLAGAAGCVSLCKGSIARLQLQAISRKHTDNCFAPGVPSPNFQSWGFQTYLWRQVCLTYLHGAESRARAGLGAGALATSGDGAYPCQCTRLIVACAGEGKATHANACFCQLSGCAHAVSILAMGGRSMSKCLRVYLPHTPIELHAAACS